MKEQSEVYSKKRESVKVILYLPSVEVLFWIQVVASNSHLYVKICSSSHKQNVSGFYHFRLLLLTDITELLSPQKYYLNFEDCNGKEKVRVESFSVIFNSHFGGV